MFFDHPLVGVGMGTWSLGEIQLSYGLYFWDYVTGSAHSSLLQMATEMGIPGLIAWGAFVFWVIRSGIVLARYYRVNLETRPWLLVLAGMSAGLIFDLFLRSFPLESLDKPTTILVSMWFAIIVSMADKVRQSNSNLGKSVTHSPRTQTPS